MPELFAENGNEETLVMQNQLLELRQKLKVETSMYEASQRIMTSLDRRKNVEQASNLLSESKGRIDFLNDQIALVEERLRQNDLGRTISVGTVYHDVLETLTTSSVAYDVPVSVIAPPKTNELEWWISERKLTWPKIDYKITELSYRLKLNENILDGTEKLLAAWKDHAVSSNRKSETALKKLQQSRELSKQRIAVLAQALKKYASLSIGSAPNSPACVESFSGGGERCETSYTGKLLVKTQHIKRIASPNGPPFVFEFSFDQLANYASSSESQSYVTVSSPVTVSTADTNESNSFNCYAEVNLKLVQASELELTVKAGPSQTVVGIFFVRLAALLPNGPDVESNNTHDIEIEPAGALHIQFFYVPDRTKREQMMKTLTARIERKPAIKRTQQFIRGHQLISTNALQLLKCTYCQDMIFNSSGYQCKLCRLVCHKKCSKKLYNSCLHGDDKLDDPDVTDVNNSVVADFVANYNLPHRQKLVSVAIPSWCAHCGQMVSLGRKVNHRCEECAQVWHDRCDPHICKTHCGLTAKTIESHVTRVKEARPLKTASRPFGAVLISPSQEQLPRSTSALALPLSPFKSDSSVLTDSTIEDFDLIKCIGKGNFGKVMLARHRYDDKGYYAIKMLKKHSIVENEEFDSIKTEKEVFKLATEAKHPFLVQVHSIFQDDQRIYFVMEFVGGGDLMFHIQNRPFSVADCRFYTAQILLALEFLHQRGVLYRDLKLDNVLLTTQGNIKLADYGLSKCGMTSEATTRTFCGTPEFMAPELLLDEPYGLAVDYWAFGVLLYQILENRSPFYGNNEKEIFQSIVRGNLQFSPGTDARGRDLIARLLMANPAERLGMRNNDGWRAVKEHPFFAGIDWTAMLQLQLSVPYEPKVRREDDVSNFDEVFTNEDVALTPYPSFVFAKSGTAVRRAAEIFAAF